MKTNIAKGLLVGMLILTAGCAERKMTVTSSPPGALVFLDGVEKGITPVTFKFNWYGGRRFLLRRDGYQVCEEIRQVRAPLHMKFPLDAVWDLTPLPASDLKTFHFELVDEVDVDIELLRERADQMRRQERSEVQTPSAEPDSESATPSTPTPASEAAQPVQEPTSSAPPETPVTP